MGAFREGLATPMVKGRPLMKLKTILITKDEILMAFESNASRIHIKLFTKGMEAHILIDKLTETRMKAKI